MIYWDNNATTPVAPEVLEAMLPYLREQFYNPSAAYGAGKAVRKAIDTAREQVAALVGAEPSEPQKGLMVSFSHFARSSSERKSGMS